ncbi:MAG TPA: response regulator, partial [Terriglobales bacterium]|nr:response regulator [Terriglobales bacterium]
LIVDDDVSLRRSTARLLRSSGLRAESFASAQQLLNSENTMRADCLIVDVRMPGMDGLQLMRCLRANNQRIPVIFFTGEAAQEDEDWALRAGALAFLRKPVGKGALLRLVQMALESAKHATRLAKANEVLRGCLDRLASVPELDEFLGQVMTAISKQLGAVSCLLKVFSAEQKRPLFDLLFQDGRVISPAEASYPEVYRSLLLEELGVQSWQMGNTVLHLEDPHAMLKPEGLRNYLLGLGFKTLLTIPLVSRGELNGLLRFRFTEECDFSAEELELARALATQASLAIHLAQLAESAKRSAVLEERNRLAGEIHDSLAQSFAGVCMQLGIAAEETENNGKVALSQIGRAMELAKFGLSEARRSALSLRSQIIEESGLVEALRMLVERSNVPGRLLCTFRSNLENDASLPVGIRQDLLRIAQEAISNAMRHAEPTAIEVALRLDRTDLIFKVTDNGRGMSNTEAVRDGFGFANMRARVKSLNGSLNIRSTCGRGTSILVTVPVEG